MSEPEEKVNIKKEEDSQKEEEPMHSQAGAAQIDPEIDKELDIGSEDFNPLRALYETDYRVSVKNPKVVYQNVAAFESAFKKFGIWKLNSRKVHKNKKPDETKADKDYSVEQRFLPHQMAIQRPTRRRHERNLLTQMIQMEGPLSSLYKCVQNKIQIRVVTRKGHGIRGTMIGHVLFFDRHWNLLLRDVCETWKRRKYKYGENKFCGVPEDCSERLRNLGITLPEENVKVVNRKNVEITRYLSQVLIRGEQIALIEVLNKNTDKKGVGVVSSLSTMWSDEGPQEYSGKTPQRSSRGIAGYSQKCSIEIPSTSKAAISKDPGIETFNINNN